MKCKSLLAQLIFVAAARAAVLYQTGFETPTFTAGQTLSGIDSWLIRTGSAGSIVIESTTVSTGGQAVQFNASGATASTRITRTFTYEAAQSTDQIVAVSEDARWGTAGNASQWDLILTFDDTGTFIARLGVLTTGELYLATSSSTINTGVYITRGSWNHVELDINYTTHLVTGFLNGTSVSNAVSFPTTLDSALGKAGFEINGTAGTDSMFFDNFEVATKFISPALQFYEISPCRLVDTRVGEGKSGAFGPPALAASSSRDFPILSAGCSIPSTAQAYSLNLTAVPDGPLGFLSVWQTGEPYPGVSTLNSSDGSTIANAAIVPAGTSGSITVVAGNPTDLIIDINGYFAPPTVAGFDFFPLTPCRIADTRAGQGKTGAFGPPSLGALTERDFPIASSPCLTHSALAYSLNMTVVPPGPLGFLSMWPAGLAYPGVSTLNSPEGAVIANAALIPAGTGGDIDVVAANATDLIIDINGVFAAPATGSLKFYAMTPCRVSDTRAGQGFSGLFGPPSIPADFARQIPIQSSSCGVPSTAQAFALNMTVVPQGPLSFLSAWPTGQPYLGVSTLNSSEGNIIANAAIVPAGSEGQISIAAGNPTDLIIDIVGYFAP